MDDAISITLVPSEPLAQLVEHLTFNQGVAGSSPAWLTKIKLRPASDSEAFSFGSGRITVLVCRDTIFGKRRGV